ncbi:MAG: radical SAM protein [Candidatus Cloacimonadales bacterium]|nr:radical SAM protein [Candidatus Cloacimonadales bacterium]
MKILPIFIPHLGCPFDCIYCNQKTITKIDLPDNNKIKTLIENFCRKNAEIAKEIAFFGGTFTNLPQIEQQNFFDMVKSFLNEKTGIRISTRPDAISEEILDFCRQNGVRTIELGIQSFADEILSAAKRNYTSESAIQACNLIKEKHFDLGIQLMPGLPGFSGKALEKTIRTTLQIKPNFVRIYPTIVLKGTRLAAWYESGLYQPLTLDEAISISTEMLNVFSENKIQVIKIGLHSDIETEQIIAGPYHQAFGELVRSEIYLRQLLKDFSDKTLCLSPTDISLFKGFDMRMLRRLKSELKLEKIPILIDEKLPKGKFLFTDISPRDYW